MKYAPSEETKLYNEIVGKRLKLFRELTGMNQSELAQELGYRSSGAMSLIESGVRGLNKTKLRQAAQILGTFPEVLTADRNLTQEQLIDLDKFLKIRTNPKHPSYKKIIDLISNS